ncbi:uncharacterized protein BDZ99DRAFT_523809 [Mytilinidion resinicola]|uniref:Uncharacterized protein n=1 Tax=Mytilinidion resinicola TaxID=574789 RepID=A0A6A6YCC6_9PEZI|nr:uncharacterized protein BDZ99DRAFT_523809 [Mytilinidion resinicola]KAF2806360.1 hypothetical protein BDZ99DRAFT_523809 [Mytilinidion resinicola]
MPSPPAHLPPPPSGSLRRDFEKLGFGVLPLVLPDLRTCAPSTSPHTSIAHSPSSIARSTKTSFTTSVAYSPTESQSAHTATQHPLRSELDGSFSEMQAAAVGELNDCFNQLRYKDLLASKHAHGIRNLPALLRDWGQEHGGSLCTSQALYAALSASSTADRRPRALLHSNGADFSRNTTASESLAARASGTMWAGRLASWSETKQVEQPE